VRGGHLHAPGRPARRLSPRAAPASLDLRSAGVTDRPPHVAIRSGAPIVKASRALGSGQKLVWLELLELDQGGLAGAWLGADGLAARVGLGREAVEQHRRELSALGLLESHQEPGRRTASWYPTLPPECVAAGGARRPDVDEVATLARALDAHITARRTGVGGYASDSEQSAHAATPFPDARPRRTGVAPYAGAGSQPAQHPPDAASSGERGVGGRGAPVSPDSPVSPRADSTPPLSPASAGETGEAGGSRFARVRRERREQAEPAGDAHGPQHVSELMGDWREKLA